MVRLKPKNDPTSNEASEETKKQESPHTRLTIQTKDVRSKETA